MYCYHAIIQLKKQIAKLEEKIILFELSTTQQKAELKSMKTDLKTTKKELAALKGYKLREGIMKNYLHLIRGRPLAKYPRKS
jgi:hypothetical protein